MAARAAEHVESGAGPVIVVDSHARRERARAVEPFAAACRPGVHRPERTAARDEFAPLGVSVNGIDVLAARDLMNDMLLLRLAVPSRLVGVKRDDLMATAAEGAGAKASGLLKRPKTSTPICRAIMRPSPRAQAWPRRAGEPAGKPAGPVRSGPAELTDKRARIGGFNAGAQACGRKPRSQGKGRSR